MTLLGWRSCRGRLFLAVFLVGIMGAADLASQERRPKDPAPSLSRDWEQWRDPVPVSGGLRVGVMAQPGSPFNPVQLTVWLPKTDASALCIELSSQNGHYIASVPYDIRGEAPGPLRLNLPASQHVPKLRNMQPDQVAILARLADGCGAVPTNPREFVVAAWNQLTLGETVIVMLNSRLPTSIGVGAKKIETRYPCASLSGTTTAFNLRCEIPVSEMTSERRFVIEMRRGASVNTVPLPLAIPR